MQKSDNQVPCPFCGEMISRSAKACRHCGSDNQTGWSDNQYLDGIDLPDTDSYDEIYKREFGEGSETKTTRRRVDWRMIVGAVLVALFLVMIAKGMF